jgi:isochorismate hydrolase
MLNPMKLDADRAMLLVIDLQTRLLPEIDAAEDVLGATAQLVRGAAVFSLPQYVRGLGPTHPMIDDLLRKSGVETIEKMTFSSCGAEPVREKLRAIDRQQIIVAGIEAHVCVLQTVLDLVAMDYQAFVCADAVGSRHELDYDLALARMQHSGATVTTVEAALFELCHASGTDRFKRLLEIVKSPEHIRV